MKGNRLICAISGLWHFPEVCRVRTENTYDLAIMKDVLHPGEAVTGLIGVASAGDNALRIELSK